MRPRTRVALAWALWLVTFGCCAAGLLVTLAIVRPLTLSVLAEGAVYAFFFVLGSATVGLVLALRRPANPDRLAVRGRPVPPVAQFIYIAGDWSWAPAIALGVTLPALLLPNGHLRSCRWRLVVVTSAAGATMATLAPR